MIAKSAKTMSPPQKRCKLHGDAGQALVELALVVPLLTLIFVGAAEVGRIAYAAIEVNNAARAGVAYASQGRAQAYDGPGITRAAVLDAPDVSGLNVAPPTYSCSCSTTGAAISCATALTSCPSPGINVVTVQVNTSATINTGINFPGIPSSLTLRGQAIMNTEQ